LKKGELFIIGVHFPHPFNHKSLKLGKEGGEEVEGGK
jgi:hypothetical protein